MLKIIEKWLYKPKYVVVFLREFQDTKIVERKMVFNSIERIKKANSKKFIIDIENPAYSDMNKRIFFVSVDGKKTYSFYGKEQPMSVDEIDIITANHIIREITKGLMDDTKQKIMYMAIGGIVGLLLGLFVMNMIMNDKIRKLYENQLDTEEPIVIGMMRGLITCLR